MSPKLHDSASLEILQAALAGLTDQLMPVPVGSGSLNVTLVAMPGPALCALIVKPMFDPALTLASSASLVNESVGQFTRTLSPAVTNVLFVAIALASLSTRPQVANVV